MLLVPPRGLVCAKMDYASLDADHLVIQEVVLCGAGRIRAAPFRRPGRIAGDHNNWAARRFAAVPGSARFAPKRPGPDRELEYGIGCRADGRAGVCWNAAPCAAREYHLHPTGTVAVRR